MQVYANKYTENQVCKLFAFTEGALNWNMSVMPQEKGNIKQLADNKIKYYLQYIWFKNIC